MAVAEPQKAQPTQTCCYKLAMIYVVVYKENRAANRFNPHLRPISDGDAAG